MMWFEPRWSFAPREVREFRSSLRLGSWVRIVFVSAILTAAIAMFVNRAVPGLGFNWLAAFAGSVLAIVVLLLLFLVLMVTVPPLVFITRKGFGWYWLPLLDQGFTYLKLSELTSATLTIRDDGMHFLRFRTKRFCKRIGLSRGVNLDRLLDLLGDTLVVRDRRKRHEERELS